MAKKPPYAPGSTLRRPEKEMRRFNPERRARRESEGLIYGDLHRWTKGQMCVGLGHPLHPVCEFYPPERRWIESHHVRSVGSGGADENNTVALCPALHDTVHRLGLTTWCETYKLDLKSIACETTERYYRETVVGEEPEGC